MFFRCAEGIATLAGVRALRRAIPPRLTRDCTMVPHGVIGGEEALFWISVGIWGGLHYKFLGIIR